MSEKLETIVDKISELSLLEASELVKMMEEKFGVSAQAAVMPAVMPGVGVPGAGAAPAEEEKTEFDVVLAGLAETTKKISVIKAVREVTSLGLKEAKELVESAPKPIKEGITREEAEELQKKLLEAGAKVELK